MAKVTKIKPVKSLEELSKEYYYHWLEREKLNDSLERLKSQLIELMTKAGKKETDEVMLVETERWIFNGKAVELLEEKFPELVEKKVSSKTRQIWELITEAIPQLKKQVRRKKSYVLRVKNGLGS